MLQYYESAVNIVLCDFGKIVCGFALILFENSLYFFKNIGNHINELVGCTFFPVNGNKPYIALINKVAELAVSALQDFFSHILVKKLSLSISVAGDDAADTAIKYGKYCAVVYPAVGTIVRVVKCKGYGVDINPNFSEKAETEINFDFAARIFAFRLIGLAVKHGIKGIKLLAEVKND